MACEELGHARLSRWEGEVATGGDVEHLVLTERRDQEVTGPRHHDPCRSGDARRKVVTVPVAVTAITLLSSYCVANNLVPSRLHGGVTFHARLAG
jgi:hypothetical protein